MDRPTRRTTILPTSHASHSAYSTHPGNSSNPPIANGLSASNPSSAATLNRNRQYTHLAAQLATLNAHLADTENLLRVTTCQAEVVRGLGAWMGGLFMAASRVLGEEGVVRDEDGGREE